MRFFPSLAVEAGLAGLAAAQFPPTPIGITEVHSKLHPGVSISYKEVCTPWILTGELLLREFLTLTQSISL